MKHLKLFLLLMITLAVSLAFPVMAQEASSVFPWEPPPMTEWFGALEQVFAVLVVIGGYLSPKIPGLKQINSATYRVLAFAILVGAGFWYFGADILGLAMSYFFSTSFYEVVLKAIKPSPKPKLE